MKNFYKPFYLFLSSLSFSKNILILGMALLLRIITVSWKNTGPAPIEENGFSKLTVYELMMVYLTKLSSQSKLISMTIIGKSVQGREYPIVQVMEPIVTENPVTFKRNNRQITCGLIKKKIWKIRN